MRTINIKLYSVPELRGKAKASALDLVRNDLLEFKGDEYDFVTEDLIKFIGSDETLVTFKELKDYADQQGDSYYTDIIGALKPWHGSRKARYVELDLYRARYKVTDELRDYYQFDPSALEELEAYAEDNGYEFYRDGFLYEGGL